MLTKINFLFSFIIYVKCKYCKNWCSPWYIIVKFNDIPKFSPIVVGVTVLGGALILAKGTIRASVNLFESTLQRVLRNPMSFFDKTPTGRILNRLSKDTDVIDNTLPSILRSWIACLFGVWYFQVVNTVLNKF